MAWILEMSSKMSIEQTQYDEHVCFYNKLTNATSQCFAIIQAI